MSKISFKNLKITYKKKKNLFYLILVKNLILLVMKMFNLSKYINKYQKIKKIFNKNVKNYKKIFKMNKI